jgi:glycosyltransferase involved in cell wall biosynthesis
MPHISVVTPVYLAEACLEELYRRLAASLSVITDDFEILMIEDKGGDNSWELIQLLARRDSRVKGLQFSRNFGQHYGITAGLDHCDGDWVVVMDCDLQDRPEEIPRLYRKALEGFDVVVAQRGQRSVRFLNRFGSWAFHRLFSYLVDSQYDDAAGNFRIISRKVAENSRRMREQLRFFGGLIDWMGFPSASIVVQHDPRFAGRSSYSFRKLWGLALDAIIAYSDKPLRLTIRIGLMMSLLAFAAGIYILVRALLYGSPVVGWASLFVSLYFLGGIIISILGIISIYLGKSFDEAKKRPLYIVSKTTFAVNPSRLRD